MTGWFRSTKCATTSCIEVKFVKSTRSAGEVDCVEVARTPDQVLVRDSKDAAGPVLDFGPTAWRVFLDGLKRG